MCEGYGKTIFGSCACFFIVILPTVIMLSISFEAIQENEVGIRKHRHFDYVTADNELTDTGNHYVGLWHTFDTISKAQRNKGYRITGYTANIIEVDVEIEIQYSVLNSYQSIYMILYEFDDITNYLDANVEDAMRRSIQMMESEIFFSQRGLVSTTISNNVEIAIEKAGYVLMNMQLVEALLPSEMDDVVDRLVSARQQSELVTNSRDKQLASAEVSKKELLHTTKNEAIALNATSEAQFQATKVMADAELYSALVEIQSLEELIDAYYENFPLATENQIMEMVKNDGYMKALAESNKEGDNVISLDNKPTAIGRISDDFQARLLS